MYWIFVPKLCSVLVLVSDVIETTSKSRVLFLLWCVRSKESRLSLLYDLIGSDIKFFSKVVEGKLRSASVKKII